MRKKIFKFKVHHVCLCVCGDMVTKNFDQKKTHDDICDHKSLISGCRFFSSRGFFFPGLYITIYITVSYMFDIQCQSIYINTYAHTNKLLP